MCYRHWGVYRDDWGVACWELAVMARVAGVGYHIKEVPLVTVHGWARCIYALSSIHLTAVLIPRMSVLAVYLRVLTDRTLRRAPDGLMVIVVAPWLRYGLAITFECKPVAFAWNKDLPGGRCHNVEAFHKAINGPSIAPDVVMIALRIPMVCNLKTTRLKKYRSTLAVMAGIVWVYWGLSPTFPFQNVVGITNSILDPSGPAASCVLLAEFCQIDAFVDNACRYLRLLTLCESQSGVP